MNYECGWIFHLRRGASGEVGPQAHGGERGLDRIRGPRVDPVLGWEVEECQQLVLIVSDLLDGLGELRVVELGECHRTRVGVPIWQRVR